MGLEKALLNTKATDEVENDIVCKVWNLIEYADRDVYIKMLNGEDMHLGLCWTSLYTKILQRYATL